VKVSVTGTDGTDFSYRQTIADKYQIMAETRKRIKQLLFLNRLYFAVLFLTLIVDMGLERQAIAATGASSKAGASAAAAAATVSSSYSSFFPFPPHLLAALAVPAFLWTSVSLGKQENGVLLIGSAVLAAASAGLSVAQLLHSTAWQSLVLAGVQAGGAVVNAVAVRHGMTLIAVAKAKRA